MVSSTYYQILRSCTKYFIWNVLLFVLSVWFKLDHIETISMNIRCIFQFIWITFTSCITLLLTLQSCNTHFSCIKRQKIIFLTHKILLTNSWSFQRDLLTRCKCRFLFLTRWPFTCFKNLVLRTFLWYVKVHFTNLVFIICWFDCLLLVVGQSFYVMWTNFYSVNCVNLNCFFSSSMLHLVVVCSTCIGINRSNWCGMA